MNLQMRTFRQPRAHPFLNPNPHRFLDRGTTDPTTDKPYCASVASSSRGDSESNHGAAPIGLVVTKVFGRLACSTGKG